MNVQPNQSSVLLTGAGGLLGGRLAEALGAYQVAAHHHHQPIGGVSPAVYCGDLSDPTHVASLAGLIAPDVIINCAALADVDRCETDKELSLAVNVTLVANLARLFPNARLVQISTDYVFSDDENRSEAAPRPHDRPDPINVYGRHKLEAEYLTLAASSKNLVVRVNSLFDHRGRKNIFSHAYDSLRKGETIYGLVDQISNPIAAIDAARLIAGLIEGGAMGIFHVGGRDTVSRHEFTLCIADYFGFDRGLIELLRSEERPRPAARPTRAGLDCTLTERFLKTPMPGLQDGFACIARELRAQGI